jgi:protein-S-isoprenylcysteine O-methyltransferase Ste14
MNAQPAGDRPGVIVRPPLLYLGAAAAGAVLDALWPATILPRGLPALVQYPVGAALILAGLALVVACARRFLAAGTNVPTTRPTTAIVTSGLYRFSRNPIYVGLTLAYLGIAVAADSAWILALVVPVLLVMRYGVIAREERYLDEKFGDDYRRYKGSVRRWL